MHITRLNEARPYEAPRHHGMSTLRLQGAEASAAQEFTVGMSVTLPGGGAEHSASPRDRVYVVIEGQLTVVTDEGETVLSKLDSVWIAPGEARSIANRTNQPVVFLVVMSQNDPNA